MELAAVKARVKAWEKAFKAQHGRAPVKDDIKRDGDIGELVHSSLLTTQPAANSFSRPVCPVPQPLQVDHI